MANRFVNTLKFCCVVAIFVVNTCLIATADSLYPRFDTDIVAQVNEGLASNNASLRAVIPLWILDIEMPQDLVVKILRASLRDREKQVRESGMYAVQKLAGAPRGFLPHQRKILFEIKNDLKVLASDKDPNLAASAWIEFQILSKMTLSQEVWDNYPRDTVLLEYKKLEVEYKRKNRKDGLR